MASEPSHGRAALALSAAVALFLAGCSGKDHNPGATPAAGGVTLTGAQRQHIRLFTVQPSTFKGTVQTFGVVDFDNDQATSVLAPFGGPVTRILVTQGQHVDKGQALAVVNSADFSAAVSAYRKAAAAAANARRLADIDKDLLQHQGVSKREADQAETDAVGAEADRAAALKTLSSMDVGAGAIGAIQQGRTAAVASGVIRAPISGVVVDRPITPGQLLQAGTTPVFTIAKLSRVWVMAQVFEADLPAVQVGETAKVQAAGAAFAGRVENVGAQVDPATGAVAARVAVDNPGDALKKQMYVQVAIQGHQSNRGILVPVAAVLRDDENLPFVYVAQPDGSFGRRQITLGERVGGEYQIPAGLKPGDQVVDDGAVFVQFMQDQ
ncbi:MAG TPA: efflux RND transporter periplasmic adaptor subunit [Caulobacteraceae bacterium]|jgi:cobalt-zinc-cadmium efflux system membrane fusion protein